MNTNNMHFGVDYYPEQWPETMWEKDIQGMKDFGFEGVRIMEFAWNIIESEKDHFDFSLFDRFLALLEKAGLTAIIGTPTATFPIWLSELDPSLFRVYINGQTHGFGTRREGCYNNPLYRERARIITEKIAEHYAGNPCVIGFQVDNEVGHEGSDICICEHCKKNWGSWLSIKYITPRKMNDSWGNVFWGTSFTRFDQVPVFRKQVSTSQNPALILDYQRFSSDSAISWVNDQTDILRKHINNKGAKQFITTNLYPAPLSPVIDTEAFFTKMDFASWDNYPVWGDQDESVPYYFNAFVFAFVRGLKESGNFTVMEEMSGFQGHTVLGHLPPEKQVALWTNQAIARGADRIYYFRWRTAAFAQEQLCYGIHDTDNEETERGIVLKQNMQEHKELFETIAGVPYKAKACLLYDKDNARLLREQPLSQGLVNRVNTFAQVGYDLEMARQFAAFPIFNVNADVKSVKSVKLEDYSLINLPLYELSDPIFALRLKVWVKNGGTLVLGYRAGARDLENKNATETLPGIFSELTGIKVRKFESLNKTKVGLQIGLLKAKGEVWADIIESKETKVLARYKDKNKFYSGSPAVTMNSFGKGQVYYFGTSPDSLAIFLLWKKILKSAGLNPNFAGLGAEIIERTQRDGTKIQLLLNHGSKKRRILGQVVPAWGMALKK